MRDELAQSDIRRNKLSFLLLATLLAQHNLESAEDSKKYFTPVYQEVYRTLREGKKFSENKDVDLILNHLYLVT